MRVQLITELATVFRTPLTTIKGSVTALMEPTVGENREARSALLAETLTAVDGLDSLVENLLVMNRLDSGMLKPKKSRNDVVDLLSMVAEEIPNPFDRFFRGENAGSGSVGLGLSICKGIVETHGGSIAAFNNRKGGLSVSIFLPDCIAGDERRDAP